MHIRMPRSILWASPGGIAPKHHIKDQSLICTNFIETTETTEREEEHQDQPEERDTITTKTRDQHQKIEEEEGEGDPPTQGDCKEERGGGREQAGTPACIDRMPGPIVQASTGGTSPRTIKVIPDTKHLHTRTQHQQDQGHHQGGQDEGVWVKGSSEEDRARYRELMEYMEEKRK